MVEANFSLDYLPVPNPNLAYFLRVTWDEETFEDQLHTIESGGQTYTYIGDFTRQFVEYPFLMLFTFNNDDSVSVHAFARYGGKPITIGIDIVWIEARLKNYYLPDVRVDYLEGGEVASSKRVDLVAALNELASAAANGDAGNIRFSWCYWLSE